MNSGWGLQNRMARMIKASTGHTVMLACDHGYFMGPTSHLEEPRKTFAPLVPFADALAVTRGVLRNCVDPSWEVTHNTQSLWRNEYFAAKLLSDEGITTSMEDALRLNVSAVALSIFVGTAHEKQTLLSLSKLVDEGEEFGMPVIAITAVGKELEKRDARYLELVLSRRNRLTVSSSVLPADGNC